MKFNKRVIYIIIAILLFIKLGIDLNYYFNNNKYKEIFHTINNKETNYKVEKLDISKYIYNYNENELGIQEYELNYLNSIKDSISNNKFIELNKEDAISDINFLFNLLKYSYAGYLYFGSEEAWNNARLNIINNINLYNKKISSKDLEEIILNNIEFIQDGHFKINCKSPLKKYNFYYNEDFEIEEDKNGYYIREDNKKWYIESINNNYKLDNYIKLSINKKGELCNYIGFLDTENQNNIKLILKSKYEEKEKIIKLNNNKYDKSNDTNKDVAYEYTEIRKIPIIKMNRMYNINTKDDSVELFAESANKIKDEDVIIIDIRGNNGGNDIGPLKWFENFTGKVPQVEKTSIKLASLINNYITKIAANSINYESLSQQLKEEYKKELEIANNKSNKWYIDKSKEEKCENKTKIFVIIDNKVASSAESFVSYLDTLENVVFVGTNTSGVMISNSYIQCILPNSKIEISYGNELSLNNKFIEGKGFEPDIWINEEDIIERVLNLIK